jgi:hypothetical protein
MDCPRILKSLRGLHFLLSVSINSFILFYWWFGFRVSNWNRFPLCSIRSFLGKKCRILLILRFVNFFGNHLAKFLTIQSFIRFEWKILSMFELYLGICSLKMIYTLVLFSGRLSQFLERLCEPMPRSLNSKLKCPGWWISSSTLSTATKTFSWENSSPMHQMYRLFLFLCHISLSLSHTHSRMNLTY